MQTCTKTKSKNTNHTPEIMTELNPQVVVEEDNPASDENKSSTSPLTELTVAQKTAPMFAYYIKTHVLLNADIISSVYILNHVV